MSVDEVLNKYGKPTLVQKNGQLLDWMYLPPTTGPKGQTTHSQGFEIRFDASDRSNELLLIDQYIGP